jgi:hypothetical protein
MKPPKALSDMAADKKDLNMPPDTERWYLLVDERELGPFGLAQLQSSADKGMITAESRLRSVSSQRIESAASRPVRIARNPARLQEQQPVALQAFAGAADPLRLGPVWRWTSAGWMRPSRHGTTRPPAVAVRDLRGLAARGE